MNRLCRWILSLCEGPSTYASFGLTTLGVPRIILQFIAGYWLFRMLKTWEVGDVGLCMGLCAFVILMCLSSTRPVLLLPLILLIVAGLAKGGVVGNALFGNRVAVFLGEISFSIYLIHPILQIACNQIARRLHIPVNPVVAFIVLLVETGRGRCGWCLLLLRHRGARASPDRVQDRRVEHYESGHRIHCSRSLVE
ncbi:hypothetical protein LMG28614_03821 [Paraburkholderia ultramafica]|uniref:Acyltransferase 3 domain-containing protein n=1 Tax=Paraburkholderia ultramafica TaxID=1544867 RepID=A0A6S7BCT7_9BURK|nr:hypothetical protein LMG28614_03821 [Paraburkholderia ultramafica]